MKSEAINEMTGYPSIDRPWLKYYSDEAKEAKIPECTIYDYLWESNKEHLDNVALDYFGYKIPYRKMFEEINKVAQAFSDLGVKEGDTIIIAAVTIPEVIYAFYALNQLGAISNMVDPRTSERGIQKYILESKARYILTLDVLAEKIQGAISDTSIEKIITVSAMNSFVGVRGIIFGMVNTKSNNVKNVLPWKKFINSRNKGVDKPSYRKNKCCVIVHTGGTTGSPKGVMLTDDNLNAMVINAKASEGDYEIGNKFLNIMPPFIAYGLVNGIHMILSCGMENILIPQFNPDKFDKLLIKYHPTHILGVPTHYAKLFESKRLKNKDLSFLKIVGVGGDSLSVEMEKQIEEYLHMHGANITVATGYGMTEVSAAACGFHKNAYKVGSVGIPFLNTIIRITKIETLEEQSYNEQGEIWISSPTAMLGYDNNEEETKRVVYTDANGVKWIRSGDIGHMDEQGFLYIDGRIKRIIIRHDGFKVFPTQIENVIATYPEVKACCAIGRADKDHSQGKLPVVYITLSREKKDKVKLKEELSSLCKQMLPEYMQPIDFVFIDKMPLTANGKVDFHELEGIELSNRL